jgi:hypothetical protein
LPVKTVLGEALFVMERSADGLVTDVNADAELFEGFGSNVCDVTDARVVNEDQEPR